MYITVKHRQNKRSLTTQKLVKGSPRIPALKVSMIRVGLKNRFLRSVETRFRYRKRIYIVDLTLVFLFACCVIRPVYV